MSDQHEHYQARQRQRRVVTWGCRVHQTPAGQECQGCADQGELLSWDDIREARRQR